MDSVHDPETNPGGYIPMGVAENLLLSDELLERMAAVEGVPRRVLGYGRSLSGSPQFKRQMARFLGRKVLSREVAPEHLAVLAGAGSVLEILFHCLCDPGEGVLVPTPSYAGFWADLETRDELKIVTVPTRSSEGFRLTPDQLDRALAEAGRPVRALLFTSPDNPLGTVYTRGEIEEVLRWAEGAGLHAVFDEIYALSVFGDRPFTSCGRLLPSLGDSVHVVWAFSKDFGASGLRCGVLVSENASLLKAVDALAYWAACSGHTQHLLGEVISDDAWVDAYVARVRAVLGDAYARVTAALDEAAIPYFPSGAGFFVVCDLRRWLDEPTCRNAEPGFLRLCFASLPTDAAVAGVRRVAAVLSG